MVKSKLLKHINTLIGFFCFFLVSCSFSKSIVVVVFCILISLLVIRSSERVFALCLVLVQHKDTDTQTRTNIHFYVFFTVVIFIVAVVVVVVIFVITSCNFIYFNQQKTKTIAATTRKYRQLRHIPNILQ